MQTPSLSTYKNFNQFRLFIFDLDGTLYDQQKLRRRMIRPLLIRFLSLSVRTIDLKIISSFRKQREKHKGYAASTIETDQYLWSAEELNIPPEKVENCILYFMYRLPLKYLYNARYPHIDKVFSILKERNHTIAIYSDYPVQEKLTSLQLIADAHFCSTDKTLQQLKPSGKAIDTICKKMNISKKETLLIGDREDTDGESAQLAGVSFLKVDIQQARKGEFYANLLQKIKTNNGR